MAEQLLITVLNMSLTGSFVILAVCIMRIFLRKAPSIFSYCLWATVLFRLLCPVSFPAVFSPFNALHAPIAENGRIEYIPEDILRPQSASQPAMTNGAAFTDGSAQASPISPVTPDSSGLILKILAAVWLTGILIMAFYSVITLVRLTAKLKSASWERENIYVTNVISTPFVIGLIHPKIYLPSTLDRDEIRYILLHEQIHLKRGDHIVKILSFAVLCLHWFNPFVWAAFFLSGKDMEMSCDEAVIRRLGNSVKKDYTSSLLCLSTGKHIINGIPLAFGEGDTGSRIKNVLRYKKPAACAVGIAAIVCIAAAAVLLANPNRSERNTETDDILTDYGVIMETEIEGVTRQVLVSPYSGTVDIPEAGTIDTYFEPGDERDSHQLLPGDMVAITFASREDISLQETWPARYSGPAESIMVMWQGFSLWDIGDGSNLSGSTHLMTFPAGAVVPDVETAKAGDILSMYWEDTGDEVYMSRPVPEDGQSRLIASTPILAVNENEYGGKMFTVGLDSHAAQQMLSGFGFHTRFALNSGDVPATNEEIRAAEEAQAYLDSLDRLTEAFQQEAKTPMNLNDPAQQSQAGEPATPPADTLAIDIRSVSRSSRTIDSYVPVGIFPGFGEEPLAFAQDCVFKINYSMDRADYREVSFDTFAGLIEELPHNVNKPCNLIFQDDLVSEAALSSAYLKYGISFDTFIPEAYLYDFLLENQGEDALETYYSLASTETADISDAQGSESIEVYTGNIGDGDSGIILFKDASGELLYVQDAHASRAGWNNIYLGEKDGVSFLMNVYVEDRWDFGGYGYWVYRLDEQGGIRQIAGSRFDFNLGADSDDMEYDDVLFREWTDGMTGWLENCRLILSSQEGEIRTEKVSDTDRYNYETLNLKGRP